MMALVTVTVCLAGAPRVCEVREATTDAVLCLAAGRNVAEEQVPEGYTLASFRCVPQQAEQRCPLTVGEDRAMGHEELGDQKTFVFLVRPRTPRMRPQAELP